MDLISMHSGNIYSITQSKFNPQLRTPIIYTNELSANIYWLLSPNIYPNHLSHRPTSGHVTAVSVYDVFEKNNVLSDFREQQYQSGTRVSLLFFLEKSSPDSDRNRHLYNPVSHSDTVRSSFFWCFYGSAVCYLLVCVWFSLTACTLRNSITLRRGAHRRGLR